MPRDVFISHAGNDAGVAVEVCALLEARGLQCWMAPRDVAAGAVWDEAVLDAIERSRVFLLILSNNANQSQFVKNEVNRAFSQSKPIVTFRLEEVVPGRSLELYLARHHWTDAFPPPMGARVERLAGSITALLDPTASASVPSTLSTTPLARPTLASRFLSSLRALANSARTIVRRPAILGTGALLLGALIAGLAVWNLKPAPPNSPKPVTRFTITLPEGEQLAGLDAGPAVALSPDGTHLAYVATQNNTQQIYLWAMDSLEAKPLRGTEGAVSPFFSPDGQWLGFFADGKLKKVSLSGGAEVTLGDAASARGASWSSRGMIAFAPSAFSALEQVPAVGGVTQQLTPLEKTENSERWPEFLPDGGAVLFTAGRSVPGVMTDAQIAVQSLGTGERRNLIKGGHLPHYAPSGYLVYAQGGSLMAVPFDAKRLSVTGAAVSVMEGVVQTPVTGSAQYSVSQTGSLAYVPGNRQATLLKLLWISRNGVEQPLAAKPDYYQTPRLSPDGRQVAVGIAEQDSQIWLFDLSRETLTRLTFDGNNSYGPVWTPDGKRVANLSTNEGHGSLIWQLADGSGGAERLVSDEDLQTATSWSPDGQLLAFNKINNTTGSHLWVLRMGDRKAQPFLGTSFNESAARFSPDGHWLAYISDESGRYEIYVRPYPGPGGKWQISTEGGTEPVWNRNGRELFYRSGDKMMAVEFATVPTFTSGKPRALFQGPYQPTLSPRTDPNYDVSLDGQRFLMLKAAEGTQAAPTQINVVLNWFEELKQKVPTGTK